MTRRRRITITITIITTINMIMSMTGAADTRITKKRAREQTS